MQLPYNGFVATGHRTTIPSNKMYSSYGNQRRNANVLRFSPPGFKHPIDVQFPPRCLPVCERCKKNFKTREHCRGRDCHTDLAWCETYVCVSLDNSCTGDDNKLLDGPFNAKVVPPIAFNLKGDLNPLTPICAPCKDKNYTRTYCRQNKNHRQLPWSTVYVIVSLKPGFIPERSSSISITSASASNSQSNKRRKDNSGEATKDKDDAKDGANDELKRKASSSAESKGKEDSEDSKTSSDKLSAGADEEKETDQKKSTDDKESSEGGNEKKSDKKEDEKASNKDAKKTKKEEPEPELDAEALFAIQAKKLEVIPRSRTFLATVSCKTNRIEWVDVDPMLETQLPMLNDSSNDAAQDVYDMRHGNPMMHHTMQQRTMGNLDGNSMNAGMSDMDRMAMRMRMSGGNGMGMNPMGGFGGNMPSMNVPSGVFDDGTRSSMDSQMMGNSMGRYSTQDMMGHMDQMRHMDQMSQVRHMRQMSQMQQMGGGGPVPFETSSMSSRMGGYGNNGFSPQEMMQYEAMRNSREGFNREQMMNSMPSYTVSGNFPGDMPFDGMPSAMGNSELMGRMQRGGGGGMTGAGSADMMMMMQGGNMGDMMPMNRSGAGQDMLRNTTAFERMRGAAGMGASDMIGLNRASMGMGVHGDRSSQGWRGDFADQGVGGQGSNAAGNYDNSGNGNDDNKKQGPDNGESGF